VVFMSMTILWIIVAVACAIIEGATLGLTSIWFVGGAVVAAILAAFELPIAVQIIAFAVVSIALLVFTRPVVKKAFNNNRTMTNVDSVIGKHAYVTEDIDNVKSVGQIKVDGIEWTARTAKDGILIKKDTLVSITAVDGVKAIVEAVE